MSQPNFLDVGGGASKDKVAVAFKMILSDKNVKAILINIFGGIMRCDVLALGVVEAAKEMKIDIPLVVRLAGTNYEKGKKILDDSKLKIISASDLSEAAKVELLNNMSILVKKIQNLFVKVSLALMEHFILNSQFCMVLI